MKKSFILTVISVIFALLIVEISVRLFYPQSLADYWQDNEDQFGLLINKKNYSFKNHRVKQNVASYKFGEFRNRITIQNDNLKSLPKILVLGDSFTFGWLLRDEFTYVHKLQMDNLNFNFINSSVAGWGSSSYTSFVEIFCEEISPKKIIIFINSDDINRASHQKFYILRDGNLIKNKVQFKKKESITYLDKKIPFYRFLKKNSQSFILLRNVVYNIVNPPKRSDAMKFYYTNPKRKKNLKEINEITFLNEEIFKRLKSVSQKCGADLLLINNGWVEIKNLTDTNANKNFFIAAEDFFKKIDVNYYDLSKTGKMIKLYKDPYKFIFKEDHHPNKKGANLIYEASKKVIKEFINK